MRRRLKKGTTPKTETTAVAEQPETPTVLPVVAPVPTAEPEPDTSFDVAEIEADPGAFAMSPVMQQYGKYERVAGQPEQIVGRPRLDFFHKSKTHIDDIRQCVGKLSVGTPIFSFQGRYHDVSACSFLLLGNPYFFWATDTDGRPDKVWETKQGKKTADGRKIKRRGEAVVLLLPGPAGQMPEDLTPAVCGLLSCGSWTKIDLLGNHLASVEMTTVGGDATHIRQRDALDWAKQHPSHMKIPPAFRFASTFHVTVKPGGGDCPPYAVIKATPLPITEVQLAAVQAFFSDADMAAEREEVEESFAKKVAELKGLV